MTSSGVGGREADDAPGAIEEAIEGPAQPVRQQRELMEMTVRARYLGLVVLAVLAALATDELGRDRWWAVALVVAVLVPYNAACDVVMRRFGTLPRTMAFSDQALGVATLAAFPEIAPILLLALLALNATSAVAFGRDTARIAATLGVLGSGLVIMVRDAPVSPVHYLAFVTASAFAVLLVGAVARVERELHRRYSELMGGIDAIVWEQVSRRPSTLYVSQRAEELLGYPASDWLRPGFWRAHVHPDDYEEAARAYRDAIRRGENRELEYRMIAADGRVVHVQDRMRVEVGDDGRPTNVRGVMLDVTDERVAAATARQYVDLVERITLALTVLEVRDPDDAESLVVVAVNPEAVRVCGGPRESLVGRPAREVLPFADGAMLRSLAEVRRTGKPHTHDDVRIQPPDRGTRVYSIHAFALAGDAIGLSMQDVTDRTMAAEVLRRQALHDALTGLPNRTMVLERLRSATSGDAGRSRGAALLVMDLNQFKDVNDALGHEHGDRLLIEMSRRLQRVLPDVDTIARLGGDEFAVLLTHEATADTARATATTIHEALVEPFQLGGIDVQTSAAIGIALFPDHGADAEALVQRADVAMYLAKRGGHEVTVYDPEHDRSSVYRLALLGELRRAINEDQLELHFQPGIDLRTGELRVAEALVRWRHPDHGMIPPNEFIELAEISGLIAELTGWVLRTAIEQASRWRDEGLPLIVAVNLSVRNLYEPELVPTIRSLLERAALDPGLLKVEITENELMDDPVTAMEVLSQVRSMGVAASIDDFGTGYSSLTYLKHLPIDELKIDRSFVGNMTNDESDLTIVRSTIDLAHNLGLGVIAEGVEDGHTLQRLAELGCDRAQGYFITRPLPAVDCTAWLRDEPAHREISGWLPRGR